MHLQTIIGLVGVDGDRVRFREEASLKEFYMPFRYVREISFVLIDTVRRPKQKQSKMSEM